jgi:hypothetical protein
MSADHYELVVPDRDGLIHTIARRLCWDYWGDWRYEPGNPEHEHYYIRAAAIVDDVENYAKQRKPDPECTFCEGHRWFTHRVRDGSVGFQVVEVENVPCPACNADLRYPDDPKATRKHADEPDRFVITLDSQQRAHLERCFSGEIDPEEDCPICAQLRALIVNAEVREAERAP